MPTIIRHRIRRRPQTIKVIPPLPIRPKLAPQITIILLLILLLIQSIRRRLPNIHPCIRKRLFGLQIRDDAVHVCYFSIIHGILDYRGVVWEVRSIVTKERAEDCAGRCGGGGFGGEFERYFVY